MQDMSIDVFARSRVDMLYTRHASDISHEELDQAKLRLQHEDPETLCLPSTGLHLPGFFRTNLRLTC